MPQCRNTTTVDPSAAAALTFSINVGSNALAMPGEVAPAEKVSRVWSRTWLAPMIATSTPLMLRCSGAYAAAAFAPNPITGNPEVAIAFRLSLIPTAP